MIIRTFDGAILLITSILRGIETEKIIRVAAGKISYLGNDFSLEIDYLKSKGDPEDGCFKLASNGFALQRINLDIENQLEEYKLRPEHKFSFYPSLMKSWKQLEVWGRVARTSSCGVLQLNLNIKDSVCQIYGVGYRALAGYLPENRYDFDLYIAINPHQLNFIKSDLEDELFAVEVDIYGALEAGRNSHCQGLVCFCSPGFRYTAHFSSHLNCITSRKTLVNYLTPPEFKTILESGLVKPAFKPDSALCQKVYLDALIAFQPYEVEAYHFTPWGMVNYLEEVNSHPKLIHQHRMPESDGVGATKDVLFLKGAIDCFLPMSNIELALNTKIENFHYLFDGNLVCGVVHSNVPEEDSVQAIALAKLISDKPGFGTLDGLSDEECSHVPPLIDTKFLRE